MEYPEEVFRALSSDQKAMVRMATAVSTGVIPDNLGDYALGKMHNARYNQRFYLFHLIFVICSRWNTTATRVLRLYMSDIDDLKNKHKRNLTLLVHYIIGIYNY